LFALYCLSFVIQELLSLEDKLSSSPLLQASFASSFLLFSFNRLFV
jgi:hypothetical protein